jgi:hypothetical protein
VASRGARRASFWIAVAGVSIFANFAIEVLSDRVPSLGLRQFVAYAHKGPAEGTA